MAKALKFTRGNQQEFFTELRKRVNSHFKDKNISKHANTEMMLKSAVFFSTWVGSYLAIVFADLPISAYYALWAVLGFSVAFLTVNVGHDAIHGSYSSKKWVNDLLAHTFNLNGASAYMWTLMHNSAHHTYTNVEGYDEDIESAPIMRLTPEKELKKVHAYQHFFAFPLYGLATLSWVLVKDYVKFFKNEVGNYSGKQHPKKEYFFLFFYKFLYYSIFFVVPFMLSPFGWGHTLLGILLMHYCSGFTLAITFMLAHVVEKTHFPVPNQTGSLENSWAVHQLYTTSNFAPRSWWSGVFTGGLNLQVEHHLFPDVCSIHYRDISEIVEKTAHEYGHPYLSEPTFSAAVRSHYRFLKKLGSEEHYEPEAPYIPNRKEFSEETVGV